MRNYRGLWDYSRNTVYVWNIQHCVWTRSKDGRECKLLIHGCSSWKKMHGMTRDAGTGALLGCEIGCKHPYRGSSAVATCPDNNTDPLRLGTTQWVQVWPTHICPSELGIWAILVISCWLLWHVMTIPIGCSLMPFFWREEHGFCVMTTSPSIQFHPTTKETSRCHVAGMCCESPLSWSGEWSTSSLSYLGFRDNLKLFNRKT